MQRGTALYLLHFRFAIWVGGAYFLLQCSYRKVGLWCHHVCISAFVCAYHSLFLNQSTLFPSSW